MGIFDIDKKHPLEHLYDECKEVCNFIIPMNLMHYNAEPTYLRTDIIEMLKERNLYSPQYPYNENGGQKICDVMVARNGYQHGIPDYHVWFYYNHSVHIDQYGTNHVRSFLVDFIVGISGVKKESANESI